MHFFGITIEQTAVLFGFMLIGYLLRKTGVFEAKASITLSKLENYVLIPALILNTFCTRFTLDAIENEFSLVVNGLFLTIITILFSYLLTPLLGYKGYSKDVCRYGLAVPDTGFMGTAVILGVFGADFYFTFMLFQLTLIITTYSWGFKQIIPVQGGDKSGFIKRFFNPTMIALIAGILAGASGLRFPRFVNTLLTNTAGCMSPIAMILTGVVIAEYDLKMLLSNWKVYIMTFMRLLVIPCLFGLAAVLLKLDESMIARWLCVLAMPMGLNPVVVASAYGQDVSQGASMALISHVLAVITIPVIFELFL